MDLEKPFSDVKSEQQDQVVEDNAKKEMKQGGIRTMPFILANEMCDRFAGVGFHANMITYLTQQLNMPLVQASNTLTNFGGTASFTPLLGALIADSFAGQFWTITFGSIFYQLGMLSITITAILPKLHPPPCPTQVNCQEATSLQLSIFYLSLLLTTIGTGGIRPCVVTFAANQFDMTKSGVAGRKWNYFNWYYFFMGLATLTALTVIVYIQDNIGWGWGLGIPTIAMTISVIVFVLGYKLYIKPKPAGSPLVRILQVAVAAWKKRNVDLPVESCLLYENHKLDAAISTDGRLLHTDQYKWLDKAAIVTERDQVKDSSPPNLWNLATVHRVEELKSIVRVLPIWAAGILLVTASSHQGSFVLQQARTMDRHLTSSFEIPPASLSIFSIGTMLTGLVLYERLFVPFVRRFTGNPSGITCLQRMGIGYVINIFATILASLTERKRKTVAAQYHLLDKPTAVIPISVFWLVPQYCIHGLAEVFMNVGHIEFLYDQAPESMRSTAAALYCLTTSIGNYLGTMVVSLVHDYTGKQHNWLPDRNLNEGRLEYYYLLVSGIQVLNFIYYVVCASLYTYKHLEQVKECDKQDEEFYTHPTPSKVIVDKDGEVELSKTN
ncbi:protein NRT1/ PTR FAMILY 3.1-like [Amaranthus tricolor]|uniref:protein NRT1/ PTR FAMILY 3.1-like n=1 Tax=Amaranthus tricolor TaxID=29722 RepID=UPI002582D4D2|nr:protein NRT1/ PTR FAMILY 3.1-like [Amaranthus tricolor]